MARGIWHMLGANAGKEPCEHSELSPTFSGTMTEQQAMRTYDVDWGYIQDIPKKSLGYSYVSNGALSRYLPHYDPLFPNLVASSYRIKGIGRPTTGIYAYGMRSNAYAKARVTLEFGRPKYNLLEDSEIEDPDDSDTNGLGPQWAPEIDRFVTYEEIPQGSYVTPPAIQGLLAWSGNDLAHQPGNLGAQEQQPFQGTISKIFAEANIKLVWHQIPDYYVPLDTIYNCLGHTNQTTFGSRYDYRIRFAPWTMLFLGATFSRIIQPDTSFAWDIEYLFKYSGLASNDYSTDPASSNRKYWNYFYNFRAATPGFYQVALRDAKWLEPGGTNLPYAVNRLVPNPVINLNYLFEIP